MTEQREPKSIGDIGTTWAFSIQSVRVFSERIGSLADEHDRQALDRFREDFDTLLEVIASPGSPPPGDAAVVELGQASDRPMLAEPPAPREALPEAEDEGPDSSDSKPGEAKWLEAVFRNPEASRRFLDQLRSFLKSSPVQGRLLRRAALTALFSSFEVLIAELLHAYYSRYPAAMPASDRTLTLEELREIGSLDEAERFLVSKEVDSVLRESLESQLLYFGKRLKISLDPVSDMQPFLTEIAQRRNLIVHNGGVVNKTYLAKVPKDGRPEGMKEGDRIDVSEEYLADAIDALFAVGATLLQLCWRKWEPTENEDADAWAIDSSYNALTERRHRLVIRLAQVYEHVALSSDATRRVIAVNRAIGVRDEGGAQEDINAIMDALDWTSCSPRFLLARHLLKGEQDAFFSLLPRALATGEITADDLDEWPLFRSVRGSEAWEETLKNARIASPEITSETSVESPTNGAP